MYAKSFLFNVKLRKVHKICIKLFSYLVSLKSSFPKQGIVNNFHSFLLIFVAVGLGEMIKYSNHLTAAGHQFYFSIISRKQRWPGVRLFQFTLSNLFQFFLLFKHSNIVELFNIQTIQLVVVVLSCIVFGHIWQFSWTKSLEAVNG